MKSLPGVFHSSPHDCIEFPDCQNGKVAPN